MQALMNFDKCAPMCIQYQKQREYFPECKELPPVLQSPSWPHPLTPGELRSALCLFVPILEFHIPGTITVCAFYLVCLISLTHIIVSISSRSLCENEEYSLGWRCHNFAAPPPADGALGLFQFRRLGAKLLWMSVNKSVCGHVFMSLG